MGLRGLKVAIQGYGNVGSNAARIIADEGCSIIAVSDSKGGIYNPEGLNPDKVLEHKKATGSVVGFPGAKTITNEELLAMECDVLVPAALGGQLTEKNAENVRAKLIVEAANGPTTPEADEILAEKGIMVVPDILANAGGVCVSYLEWIQNLHREHWPLEEVNRKLEEKMSQSYHEVKKVAQEKEVDMRKAAMILAVGRVADSLKTLGLWP
jgi:glutamate dehydrogenase (NAD(P)+)